MLKVFVGYILAAVSFTTPVANGSVLVLPPPFVGLLLMVFGCRELKKYSERFNIAAVVGAVVAVLLLVEWSMLLFGMRPGTAMLIGAVTPLIRLIFDWLLISAVCATEKDYGAYLYGAALRVLWVLQFVVAALVLLGLLSPMLIFFSGVGVLAGVVLSLVFVWALYRSKQAFEHLELALLASSARENDGS